MSPEQAQGKPVDARSDVFSFGVVLYEMVTGRRAFNGDTNISVISSILRDTPAPIATRRWLLRAWSRCHAVSRKDPGALTPTPPPSRRPADLGAELSSAARSTSSRRRRHGDGCWRGLSRRSSSPWPRCSEPGGTGRAPANAGSGERRCRSSRPSSTESSAAGKAGKAGMRSSWRRDRCRGTRESPGRAAATEVHDGGLDHLGSAWRGGQRAVLRRPRCRARLHGKTPLEHVPYPRAFTRLRLTLHGQPPSRT